MTKKGENIYKRKDGRWEGRYIKDRGENQKIIYGYIYGKKYSEVKEKLILKKANIMNRPTDVNIYYSTLNTWIMTWMKQTMKRKIKNTTYYNYYRLINNYILPTFGELQLYDVTQNSIQNFIDTMVDNNLSSGTIRNIFNILRKSFQVAVDQNFLKLSPCDNIELPKVKRNKVCALSYLEQEKLENAALRSRECSPIIIALYTGMRIGEISGLRWIDIDFDTNKLFVKRTSYRVLNEENTESITKIFYGRPKSVESERIIPIANNLKTYLLEKQKYSSSDFVISNQKGGMAEPRVISYWFKKVIKEADIEDIHFHALRHTFATRCLENRVDIASLSKLLGHQSTKMTLDTYTDSVFEKRQEAIGTIDAMLSFGG